MNRVEKEDGELKGSIMVWSEFDPVLSDFSPPNCFIITDNILLARRFMSVQEVETYYTRLDEVLSLVLVPSHNKLFDESSAKRELHEEGGRGSA